MSPRRVCLPALATLALAGLGGCQVQPRSPAPGTARADLAPSPRIIAGAILTIDAGLGLAFVEPNPAAPAPALAAGSILISRRPETLTETGRLEVSRHRRARTLGTRIIAGQPAAGDEVVWVVP